MQGSDTFSDLPFTFLGIDILMKENDETFLHQERFADPRLDKMQDCKDNKCVRIDKLPTEPDVPTIPVLGQLQPYSGECDWLAARTRPDISYLTSLLNSSGTKFAS